MTNSLSARSVDYTDDDDDDEIYLYEVFNVISTFNISFISEPLIYFTFHDNTLPVPHIILSAFTE
jgi:hypothetical protein